jgi:predicted ATP-grasp superfamily ATP-dependent carboligase
MDISIFIPKKKKEIYSLAENKKIMSNTFLKQNVLRKFMVEISKIPSDIFKVDEREKHQYRAILDKIEDFEESNVKFFAYCFLIARHFEFNYENLVKNFYEEQEKDNLKIGKIIDIFFSQDEEDKKINKEGAYLYKFLFDIFINCKVVIDTRNKYSNMAIDFSYQDDEEDIDPAEFEKREKIFDFE